MDTKRQGYIDFNTFRTRLPNALNLSLSSKRAPHSFSPIIDALAVFIAVMNLFYVVYFSYNKESSTLSIPAMRWGFLITIISISDLGIRSLLPYIKFDTAFDSLACIACLLSIIGEFELDFLFCFSQAL